MYRSKYKKYLREHRLPTDTHFEQNKVGDGNRETNMSKKSRFSNFGSKTLDETNERHGGAGTGRFSFATPRRGGTGSTFSSNDSSQIDSNSHTNMLIQSAARSVLDGTTPTSHPMSDDGTEYSPTRSTKPVPTLESLETKPIPPMPDEQDRKRFIVSKENAARLV